MLNIPNINYYSKSISFKANNSYDSKENNIKNLVPDFILPQGVYIDPFSGENEYKKDYMEKLYQTYFDENGKMNPEITKFLDNEIFEIELQYPAGEKINSTLKDYIRASFRNPFPISDTVCHGTGAYLHAKDIINNGFDPKFIKRTNLGPGFYFSSEEYARLYGILLKADFKGIIADANAKFYESIEKSNAKNKLSEFLGFSNEFSAKSMLQSEFSKYLLNEYCRNFIVEGLGIDAGRGVCGNAAGESCLCVYNPRTLTNIRGE